MIKKRIIYPNRLKQTKIKARKSRKKRKIENKAGLDANIKNAVKKK